MYSASPNEHTLRYSQKMIGGIAAYLLRHITFRNESPACNASAAGRSVGRPCQCVFRIEIDDISCSQERLQVIMYALDETHGLGHVRIGSS